MADDFVELYPSKGGDKIDSESLTVSGTPVKRQRTQVVGATAAEIQRVKNTPIVHADYGAAVRPIPGTIVLQSAVWDSGTAVNTALTVDCSGFNTVHVVTEDISSPTSGRVDIEGSVDGTVWLPYTQTRAFLVSTLAEKSRLDFFIGESAGESFIVQCGVFAKVRVRLQSALDADIKVAILGSISNTPFGTITAIQGDGSKLRVAAQGPTAHGFSIVTPPVLAAGRSHTGGDAASGNIVTADAVVTRFQTDRNGDIYTRGHPSRFWTVPIDVAGNGNNNLKAAPGAGLSLHVTDYFLEASAAVTPILKEDGAGANTTLIPVYAAVAGTRYGPFAFRCPIKLTANKTLDINLSAAIGVKGYVNGFTAS